MGVAAEVREGAAETLFRASQVLGAKLPNDQRPTMRILGICRWGGVPLQSDPNRRRGVSDLRRVQKQ